MRFLIHINKQAHLFLLCCAVLFLSACQIIIYPAQRESAEESIPYIWKAPLSTGEEISGLFPVVLSQYGVISNGSKNGMATLKMMYKSTGALLWEWQRTLGKGDRHFLLDRVYVYQNAMILHETSITEGIDIVNGSPLWGRNHNYPTNSTISGMKSFYFFGTDKDRLVVGDCFTGIEFIINAGNNQLSAKPPITYTHPQTQDTMLIWGSSSAVRDTSTVEFYFKTYLTLYNWTKKELVYQLLQREGYGNDKTGNLAPTNVLVVYNNRVYMAVGKSIQCNDILTGRLIWRREFTSNFYFSRIIEADGKIIGNGDDEGIMYALDPNTGMILWEIKTTTASGDIFAMNGIVYMVGLGDGRLHAIDIQTGKRLWRLRLPNNEDFSGNVTGENGFVYVHSRLNLYCYKAAK